MLVFSALVPHPPIIIPTIGKENLNHVRKTIQAMKELEKILYASKPDIIMIVSPHTPILSDAFTINLSPTYKINFHQFGDLVTKKEFKSSPLLIDRLHEDLEDAKIPTVLISEENLDHGSGVPLYYLTQHLKEIAIIPLGYSLLDFQTHLDFGNTLKDQIIETNKRVAFIASGDLSHRLNKNAPAGFSPQGKIFDEKLIELLKNKDIKGIVGMEAKLIEEAGECGFRSILILLGLLQNINFQPKILSYEAPFGVGYLVAQFKLR